MVKPSVKSLSQLFSASALSLALLGCGGDITADTDTDAVNPAVPVSDWQLVWSDEFDGDEIDTSNWNFEENCQGGGNNEKQCYTADPSNAYVSDGMLNIVARPAEPDSQPLPYTSARLTTQGKQEFTYGRIEMRAQLPSGQGTWPAFWMLNSEIDGVGSDRWPIKGEIDIMEAVNLGEPKPDGGVQTDIFGTLYYGNPFPNQSNTGRGYTPPDGVNPADGFHTYAIEWQEGEIRWYMDDYLYATQRQSTVRYNSQGEAIGLSHKGWFMPGFDPITGEETNFYTAAPFNEDFYVILNLAVGGDFPENFNRGGVDPAVFEEGQKFVIDYVRVYECSVDPVTGKGCDTVRGGYANDYEAGAPDTASSGSLLEGEAPSPTPPAPPVAQPLTIFDDGENPDWPLWDCCGGTTPEVVMDDAVHGAVAEFQILDNAGTVLGFNSRLGESGEPFNAGGFLDNGNLSFEMKVVNPPTAATTWLLKVEADGNTSFAEVPLNTSLEGQDPVAGEWQTYTFPIKDLSDAGLDVGAIDVIMIFPAWATGEGAQYRVDNVKIGADEFSFPSLVLFEDGENPEWPLWDCCGGTTPAQVEDDAEHGTVAEFQINDNNGTVLGFYSRDAGQPFDASALLTEGVFEFEMKVVNPPTADTTWLIKLEAGGNTSFAEVPVTTSVQGEAPRVGEWQTYTFPLIDLSDAGLDVSEIDVVMIFPAWATGEGAVYRVDNAKIYNPNASGGPSGPLLEVFADGPNEGWPLWDCCGGTTPEVVMDDAEHGAVAEFQILDNNGTVLGFFSRDAGEPFNANSILTTGVFQFEMKVVNPPTSDTTWLMKIEADGNTSFAELPLSSSQEGVAPVVGEWQTYTWSLLDLSDAGLDVGAIDVIMMFPAWATGEGAVYRVDNVYIGNPSDISGDSSGGGSEAALTLFADQVNEGWPLWDCCGGTTPTVEMDDAEHGATAEFQILDNAGTVLGFFSRDAGEPFNAEDMLTTGVFQFEMKVVSMPDAADTPWLLKIEADGNTSFAEVNLNTSIEGHVPVEGEWQTYTFDLLSLFDAGLDLSAIDVVMVFPAWGTGGGAVYRLDNVVFKEQ